MTTTTHHFQSSGEIVMKYKKVAQKRINGRYSLSLYSELETLSPSLMALA